MAIKVMIKRRVKPGENARQLIPLIMHLRTLATVQPGYISGETLRDMEYPEQCVVISTWESMDDWNRWLNSQARADIQQKIDALAGGETSYSVYAPMVGR